MTGGVLIGLILLSMAWLFFLGGLIVNWMALRKRMTAKEGDSLPSSLGFVPGVVGSLTVFFTLPGIMKYGIDVPWPWLWILFPLVLDPYCLGWVFLVLLGRR